MSGQQLETDLALAKHWTSYVCSCVELGTVQKSLGADGILFILLLLKVREQGSVFFYSRAITLLVFVLVMLKTSLKMTFLQKLSAPPRLISIQSP